MAKKPKADSPGGEWEKASKKRGRGRPRKVAEDEQSEADDPESQPIGTFSGEQQELIESDHDPKLERIAKRFAVHKDNKKTANDAFNGSKAELILKMQDLNIKDYYRHGVHIHLKEELNVDVIIE